MRREIPLKDTRDVSSENTIFAQEQEHLSATYKKLKDMEADLEDRISAIAEKAAAEKLDIRENLALNFDGDAESMETYIEFEVMNHSIDQYNIDRDSSTEKLSRVKRLLKAPYFAKVQLRYEPDEEPEEYYIGSTGVSENAMEPLVIDWRSPVAETYYNQDNGRTFYTVEGRRIDVDLLLRRQYELEEDRLQGYFDTQIALEDPLLIRSLTRQRSDKMQAITATIQKEQNAVVRHENVPVLLVNGIAGSGKTSVLLQRIAWLFYRQRDTLRPDEVVLMTLNPIFRRYIDQVLPDMGEMNPVSLTWNDFLAMAGVSGHRLSSQAGASGTLLESLQQMEDRLPSLQLEPDDLRPIHQKSLQVLSPSRIADVLAAYENIPTGERLIQIAIDDLKELAKHEIRRRERDEEREDGEDSADMRADRSVSSEARAEDNRIQNQYGGAFYAINTCQWLDIDRIGCRLLGKKRLSAIEWLYLRMLLTGQKDVRTKYVMVDEVQDYTPAQLLVLKKYFPRARFMLLGDEFQAIREGTSSFAQIHELFGGTGAAVPGQKAGKGPVTELSLMTSYRSSPEITALFAALLPPEKQILVSSVQPSGTRPAFHACGDREEYKKTLVRTIQEAGQEEGLTAVICAGTRKMEKTAALLAEAMGDPAIADSGNQPAGKGDSGSQGSGSQAAGNRDFGSQGSESQNSGSQGSGKRDSAAPPQSPAACPVPVLRSGDSLPEKGVFLITLAHAKGLEFDSVILPDADPATYPDTPLARHRLYTALSRATRRLTVLSNGKLTSLFGDALPED